MDEKNEAIKPIDDVLIDIHIIRSPNAYKESENSTAKLLLKWGLMSLCALMMAGSVVFIASYTREVIDHHSLDRRVSDAYDFISTSYTAAPPVVSEAVMESYISSELLESEATTLDPDYEKFLPLLEINEDFIAMIIIPGTNIQLPIVQYKDNVKYLNLGFDGKASPRGTIFLDYDNLSDFSNINNVLYGHHMSDGTMFRDLTLYKNINFYKNAPLIYIDSPYGMTAWLVFAAYTCEPTFQYFHTRFSRNGFENLIGEIQSRSLFSTNVDVNASDKMLTLSTCDYAFENARFAVHARRLREDEVVPSEFVAEKNTTQKAYNVPDQQRLTNMAARNITSVQHPLTQNTYFFQNGENGLERYVGNFSNVQGPYTTFVGAIDQEYFSWVAAGSGHPAAREFYLISGGLNGREPGLFLLRSSNVEGPYRLSSRVPITPEGVDARWPVLYTDEFGNVTILYVVEESEREVLYSTSLNDGTPATLAVAPLGAGLRPVGIALHEALGKLVFWKEGAILKMLKEDGSEVAANYPESRGRMQIFNDTISRNWMASLEEHGTIRITIFDLDAVSKPVDAPEETTAQLSPIVEDNTPTQDNIPAHPQAEEAEPAPQIEQVETPDIDSLISS